MTTNAKPPAPYVMDMTFTVHQHAPPLPVPTDLCRSSLWISEEQSQVRDSLSPIAWCLQNPPQEGEPGSGAVDLLVVDNFKVGDEQNSQVFLVESQSGINKIEKGMKLVAKAYDPLYVDHAGELNPSNVVDEHYSREVYSYKTLSDLVGLRHLDKPHEGKQREYLGQYIPPLVQDFIYKRMSKNFGEWVDWDWKSWFNYQFADTEELITEDMWNAFNPAPLPARIAKRINLAGQSQKRSRRKIR